MESIKEEALRAKENAEKLFAVKDFAGAKNYALKAQTFFPDLEGISQMVATFEVYAASVMKIDGETDFYSILGLEPSADRAKLKKQYRQMAVLLHPDKNKTVGADGAFKLVSEAWTLLSDTVKRNSYDLRRSKQFSYGVVTGFDNCSKSSVSHDRLDSFWTVCTSCHVQYEYLRKYVNKRLSCKNCRGIFIAVETGAAPVNGSYPYSNWSCMPENGYGSHGCGVTYIPTTAVYLKGNGSRHGSEYGLNASSFQWSSYQGASGGVADPKGLSKSAKVIHQTNGSGSVMTTKSSIKHYAKHAAVDMGSNGYTGHNEQPAFKAGGPTKKRKVEMGSSSQVGHGEMASKTASEVRMVNGIEHNSKLSNPSENSIKCCSAAPAFDARKLLMEKARTEIRKKLEEMRLASAAAAAAAAIAKKNKIANTESVKSGEAPTSVGFPDPSHQSELKKTVSLSITVPDSDFHDFDKDRSEECFKPKQIWAIYDEEDGMPRLYCLIRQIISLKPFKIHISYLNSKTDTEFGLVNWINCGFTKSCGNFRAFNSDIIEEVNIFSHLLSREKAGRGGCVRIYPKSGDIWAVYQNWSPNWDRSTPDEVRHRYEMVEVLDDYSEELGVCVTPLVKLDGFKTVYQGNKNKAAIRWIPRREMLRFSHQVPSWLLKGQAVNLLENCWDLDPAATPDELLQAETKVKYEEKPSRIENFAATPNGCLQDSEIQAEEKPSRAENATGTPDELHLAENKGSDEEKPRQMDISIAIPDESLPAVSISYYKPVF